MTPPVSTPATEATRADLREALAALARARAERLPHMCRDDHPEIRHAVSDDDERCPVCRERDRANAAKARATEAIIQAATDRARADGLAADLAATAILVSDLADRVGRALEDIDHWAKTRVQTEVKHWIGSEGHRRGYAGGCIDMARYIRDAIRQHDPGFDARIAARSDDDRTRGDDDAE